MSFRTVDLICPVCQYETDNTFDLRGLETEEQKQAAMVFECPACAARLSVWTRFWCWLTRKDVPRSFMTRCWRSAPSIGFGSDNNPVQHERMKQSFKERFLKKELNDLRHKHGRARYLERDLYSLIIDLNPCIRLCWYSSDQTLSFCTRDCTVFKRSIINIPVFSIKATKI